jgi:hypothetical protein
MNRSELLGTGKRLAVSLGDLIETRASQAGERHHAVAENAEG